MSQDTGTRPPFIAVPAMSSKQIHGLRFAGSVVANAVLDAIVRAGGQPVIIHPGAEFTGWDRIDGIVLPGGSDIAPTRYGQEAAAEVAVTDFDGQDDADARVIEQAESAGVPALLICRGMQLWNVERGGTLTQHWPTDPQQHTGTVHDVRIEADSLLGSLPGMGQGVDVSSYHHQAVDRVGRGLRVVATAEDGCVEALEDPERRIIAVQWHPEDRADHLASDQALFDWIVQEARVHAAQRDGGAS